MTYNYKDKKKKPTVSNGFFLYKLKIVFLKF